jgi:hypothetical protein
MILLNGAFILGVLFSLQGYAPNPAVPYSDPAIAANLVPVLSESVRDVHPRLLVTSNSLPALRAFYNSTNAEPYRSSFLSYLPSCYTVPATPKFQTDATEGQVQGLWRIPTVAYHYLMTGDTNSFNAVVAHMKWLMSFRNWDLTSGELDCGMSAGNILTGAALAFDWLYNDLDPVFREQFRAKLWYQARAMNYAGHLGGATGAGYWTNDPQNNHRWHRDSGLSLAVLTAYDGTPEKGWLLDRMLKELQLVAAWLPEDGTSHESASYLCFGGAHLTLALQASDDCLGTAFLQQNFFEHTPGFVLSSLTPELPDILPYGDTGGSLANYVHYLWKAISVHQLPDEQAAMERLMPTLVSWCNSFAWMSLVWHDTSLNSGNATNLPQNSFWPDIGIAYTRTGWATNDAAAMFKCGPLGGYKLNEYRAVAHNNGYVNVAHDDPDANSFVLFNSGELLAETDRYSFAKRSANYNTVLVNEIGQMVPGRVEPQTYSQPGSGDMSQMAKVTAWRDAGDVTAVEGEASGSYLKYSNKTTYASRPALSRFRRTFIWVKDRYVLVLDDIRSTQPANITWLMQSGDVEVRDAASGLYRLRKGAAGCEFQLVADIPFSATVTNSPADNRNTLLGWKQLRAVAPAASAVRFASVYDLWSRGSMTVALTPAGTNQWTVAVAGSGVNDVWIWQASSGGFVPSTLSAVHQGDEIPFFVLDAVNSVPPLP